MNAYEQAVHGDAPVAWWKLDEPQGAQQALDSSGGGYHSTAVGVTLFGQDPGGMPAGLPGPAAGTGGNGITVPFRGGNWPAFTAEIWVRPADTQNNRFILGTGRTWASPYTGMCLVATTGGYVFRVGNGSSQGQFAVSAALEPGQWQYLAISLDGGIVQVYADGAQSGSGSHAAGLLEAQAGDAGVLFLPGEPAWQGLAMQAAFYDHALTPQRIAEHYQLGTTTAPGGAPWRAWTGTQWAEGELKAWTGSGWASVRVWDGNDWIP